MRRSLLSVPLPSGPRAGARRLPAGDAELPSAAGGERPAGAGPAGLLQPGAPLPKQAASGPYEGNAWAISQGERLYEQYNCVGCHFHGGGGIGPPLMDELWIYGGSGQNIHDTIVQGRPNGMPSYGGHIPDDQVWMITAYVRTLSGQVPKTGAPTRNDELFPHPSEQAMPQKPPKPEKASPPE